MEVYGHFMPEKLCYQIQGGKIRRYALGTYCSKYFPPLNPKMTFVSLYHGISSMENLRPFNTDHNDFNGVFFRCRPV